MTVALGLAAGLLTGPGASGGTSTRFAPIGPPGGVVIQILVDPAEHFTVFAATAGGLFRSADEGLSWKQAWSPSEDPAVYSVAIPTIDHDVIYASNLYDGVYRSDDGGRTWIARPDSGRGEPAMVAVDPVDPDGLWLRCLTQY